uniref:Uncharacterized protein n=1 Tax=Clytia hemisphaerica TaxID=252671 RepID=A0A7M5XI32_9CNID|eukprot:TCONS_00008669-protein
MTQFQIAPYEIQKHAAQVQELYDRYLIPTYLKRLGIGEDERTQYSDIEDVLDVNAAYNEKFEGFSFVVIDSSGQVKGVQLSYMFGKDDCENAFPELNRKVVEENKHKESIMKYCQHRYEVCKILYDLYERYGFERAIYLESTVLHPDVRGKGINQRLTDHLTSHTDEVIFVEGQIPVDVYIKHYGLNATLIGEMVAHNGFLMVTRILSYDLFVVPIEIRLSKKTKSISSKL